MRARVWVLGRRVLSGRLLREAIRGQRAWRDGYYLHEGGLARIKSDRDAGKALKKGGKPAGGLGRPRRRGGDEEQDGEGSARNGARRVSAGETSLCVKAAIRSSVQTSPLLLLFLLLPPHLPPTRQGQLLLLLGRLKAAAVLLSFLLHSPPEAAAAPFKGSKQLGDYIFGGGGGGEVNRFHSLSPLKGCVDKNSIFRRKWKRFYIHIYVLLQ